MRANHPDNPQLYGCDKSLPIWDVRVLRVLEDERAKNKKLTKKEFFENIGFSPSNFYDLRRGNRSFTHHQILATAKRYNRSIDWIYGLTEVAYRKEIPQQSISDTLIDIISRVKALENIEKQKKKLISETVSKGKLLDKKSNRNRVVKS